MIVCYWCCVVGLLLCCLVGLLTAFVGLLVCSLCWAAALLVCWLPLVGTSVGLPPPACGLCSVLVSFSLPHTGMH